MTDAPPPSIPPSIPPRKRPSAEAGARVVTTVAGRGEPRTNGTVPAPSDNETRPAPVRAPVEDVRPASAPRREAPHDEAPAPFPVVGQPSDDDLPEGPSPLAVAVEQTGQWLRKAASATGASMSAAYASLTRPREKDDAMTANPQATTAPPRTAPPTAPATTAGSPTVRPASGRTPVVGGPGPRRVRMEAVLRPGGRVAPGRLVKLPHESAGGDQGRLGAGVGRQPVPMAGLPGGIHGHVPLDEGEDLAPALGSEEARRPGEPGGLQVPEVLVHGRGPGAHRPQDLPATPGDAPRHPPRRKRDLLGPSRLVTAHGTSIGGIAPPAACSGPPARLAA